MGATLRSMRPLELAVALVLGIVDANMKKTMYVGGTFQTVGIEGTEGIARVRVDENNVPTWSSVGSGVYSPSKDSTVHAIVRLDAPKEILVGGDFSMAGHAIGSNVDNQTAAWGFAHFDGNQWLPGWQGLRMLSSSKNVVHTILHTHVYGGLAAGMQEHVIIGGQFFAQVGSTFIANVAHWNGQRWSGLYGNEAPSYAALPIKVIQKFSSSSSSSLAGGPQDRIMIGGSNYLRFYNAKTTQLEASCASNQYSILALSQLCNGWVYAAVDGPEGTKRFNLASCSSAGSGFGGMFSNISWRAVPEASTGCELTQVSDLRCVDDHVVAVGDFKMPVYRAAWYDTTSWNESDSRKRVASFGHASSSAETAETAETGWLGNTTCCDTQS